MTLGVVCIILAVLVFLLLVSTLRWRMDFYALFSFLVIKKLPTPSKSEMDAQRLFVVENVVKDFFRKSH